MKHLFKASLSIFSLVILLCSCDKGKDNQDYNDIAIPVFQIYHEPGNVSHIFAKCITTDILLDTVLITDPINFKYTRYFGGQQFNAGQEIDLGDTFLEKYGTWKFIIRGKRATNKLPFDVYQEVEF